MWYNPFMRKSKYCFLLIFFVFITSCLFEGKKDTVSPDVNGVPMSPQGVCSSPEDSGVAIGWANVNNVKSYNVYMHTEPGITKNNYTKKYENADNPFVAKDLINARTYYFCVTSVNGTGESELSAEISCIPKLRDMPCLQVSPASAKIKKGGIQQFEAIYFNEVGKIDTSVAAIWKSSDTTVAAVSTSGLAKSVNIGTAIISATVKEKKGTAILDVLPIAAGSAPDFTLPDIDGKNVSLTDFSGKVIILDFWATWCSPCRSEIPHFVELYNTYKDKGLVIIGIDVDSREDSSVLKPFAAKYGITYPLLLGTEQVENLYGGIQSIPTTFIIDRNGDTTQKFVGAKGKSVFEEEILKLL